MQCNIELPAAQHRTDIAAQHQKCAQMSLFGLYFIKDFEVV
jgi:hypothetical protein